MDIQFIGLVFLLVLLFVQLQKPTRVIVSADFKSPQIQIAIIYNNSKNKIKIQLENET